MLRSIVARATAATPERPRRSLLAEGCFATLSVTMATQGGSGKASSPEVHSKTGQDEDLEDEEYNPHQHVLAHIKQICGVLEPPDGRRFVSGTVAGGLVWWRLPYVLYSCSLHV